MSDGSLSGIELHGGVLCHIKFARQRTTETTVQCKRKVTGTLLPLRRFAGRVVWEGSRPLMHTSSKLQPMQHSEYGCGKRAERCS